MPGLVVFRRRWSVGSDDLIVPGAVLLSIHSIWIIILGISLLVFDYDTSILSIKLLWYYQIGYLGILLVSAAIELAICIVSMRGSILDTGRRSTMNYLIYLKSVAILFDISWLVLGIIWIRKFYFESPIKQPKEIVLALIISNWLLVLTIVITIWCTFDAAGRSWVKMKKYQRSMRESESRFNYKRSGSMNRNWRQRKVIRAYQDSWDHRCRLLFCCMGTSDRNRNSFTDIARLLSDFFRELDVVPSDVVAGLVLLRKFQKLEREAIVRQRKNGTYEFLSGVAVTERTQFLALNDAKDYDFFQTVIHYMYFAQGAYGWPMYFMINRTRGLCHLSSELRCCFCCCGSTDQADVINDNCCFCNYAALKKTLKIGDIEIIYATYHVDIGETPFFVAIDYTQKKIVVSIRGTLSMKDVLTDLNAEGEVLPLEPPRDDWLGHKGMVQAAIYIRNKLDEENLIQRALTHNPTKNTTNFGLVLVGHSLGAGTAAILAILMKPQHPSLQCFSYSPPGGLLSMPAVEYTKSFITSVVVGKDVVPRIGLHQMEALRADLINAIKRSVDPKWKTITCSALCCGCAQEPTSVVEMSSKDTHINQYKEQRDTARTTTVHPTDSSIALTFHQPLYPPGRIIHIVRHHPKADEQMLSKPEPVYQAIWADTTDFDEVIISPVMLQDHMPDKVLAALKKVVTVIGPRKPQRQSSNAYVSLPTDHPDTNNDNSSVQTTAVHYHRQPSSLPICVSSSSNSSSYPSRNNNHPQSPSVTTNQNQYNNNNSLSTPTTTHKICLETSFTNLQSPLADNSGLIGIQLIDRPSLSSKTSSIAGSLFGRSQMNSIQHYDDISSIDDTDNITGRSPSGPSEATTIIMVDNNTTININNQYKSTTQYLHQNYRIKNVAFDMTCSSSSNNTLLGISKSPSPLIPPKSILHRQLSGPRQSTITTTSSSTPTNIKKPSNLPLRRASDGTNKNLDLIHDDWFGLAPLASPETLSEISSISSRTSAALSLANSIERYLQKMSVNETGTNQLMDEIFESQMHTPKVMRRAPKFTENLANCADDYRANDQYKRMGQIFLTSPRFHFKENTSQDSSQDSFESASSSLISKCCDKNSSSKSADNLVDADEQSDSIMTGDNKLKKLTFSDSAILNSSTECSSNCPQCPCKMLGGQNDCCRQIEHSSCFITSSIRTNASSCDTYYSASASSIDPITTLYSTPKQHQQIRLNRLSDCGDGDGGDGLTTSNSSLLIPEEENVQHQLTGILESHFPVFNNDAGIVTSETSDRLSLIPTTDSPILRHSNNSKITNFDKNINHNNNHNSNLPQTISIVQKRSSLFKKSSNSNNDDDKMIFARNESLPLLAHLSENKSSPSFVKRKSTIYPINRSATNSPKSTPSTSSSNKNESSV